MGQEEVINFLLEIKRPVSRAYIAECLNAHPCQVSKILNKLLKHNEIKIISLDYKESQAKYKVNRRMREYYIG
jgi:hypothetical protein